MRDIPGNKNFLKIDFLDCALCNSEGLRHSPGLYIFGPKLADYDHFLLLLSVGFESMNPVPSRLSIICRSVCLTVGRTGMYLLHV